MIEAVDAGDLPRAREIDTRLIPAVDAIMHTSQGAIQAKAALKMQGVIASDRLRMPLLQGPPEHLTRLRTLAKQAEVGALDAVAQNPKEDQN